MVGSIPSRVAGGTRVDLFVYFKHVSVLGRASSEKMESKGNRRFSEYFRRCLETETSWACRRKIDNFFLHTDPFWKPSKERLAFLERSFGLPGSNSNTILRLIATRTEPVDVERYESRMRMIQH